MMDCHVHTSFSPDSVEPMKNMINKAISLNMERLTFTDHLEFGEGVQLDLDGCVKEIEANKKRYEDKIEILKGVEVGYKSRMQHEIERTLDKYDFDFILCSTHELPGIEDVRGIVSKEEEQKIFYNRYFENMLKAVTEFSNYDIYGHIDYVIRYGGYDSKLFSYKNHSDVIDKILIKIIESGKGIEVNTSGMRYGLGSMHPNEDIVRRYRELGGEIITVGSDAHKAADLAADFDQAYEMLDRIGFEYIASFKDRQVEFIKIENQNIKKVSTL